MESPTPAPQSASGTTATVELAVEGMHCASCAALIEEVLGDEPAVQKAAVDLADARASVTYDPSVLSVDDVRRFIAGAGYTATVPDEPAT